MSVRSMVMISGAAILGAALLISLATFRQPTGEDAPVDGDNLAADRLPSEIPATPTVEIPLGLKLKSADGSAQDRENAAALLAQLQQAASDGDTAAMVRLGLTYKTGLGALQNYQQAVSWIERAAQLGDPAGMLELGRLYRDGVGVGIDPVLAYVWLNRAAAALNTAAAREREIVAEKLSPEQLQQAQALSSLK